MSSLRDPAPDPGIDEGEGSPSCPYWPNSGSNGGWSDWQTEPSGGTNQLGQVVGDRLVDAGARVLEVQVTVALVGEQDGVAEQLLGSDGVAVERGGVVALVDQQDRVRGGGSRDLLLRSIVACSPDTQQAVESAIRRVRAEERVCAAELLRESV